MTTETQQGKDGNGRATSAETLTVTDNRTGKQYEIPIEDNTIRATELRKIKTHDDDFGLMTYDPAYMATASCRSAITYIDGDKGILEYRGYPIEQLAEKSSFLEVAYLLLHGELPNKSQFSTFENDITHHTMMHESHKNFFQGFHHNAHPMAMLAASVASLSAFYHDDLNVENPEDRKLAAIRLIAKMPTIASAIYRHSIGWPNRYPRNNLEYVTRFLHTMFEVP